MAILLFLVQASITSCITYEPGDGQSAADTDQRRDLEEQTPCRCDGAFRPPLIEAVLKCRYEVIAVSANRLQIGVSQFAPSPSQLGLEPPPRTIGLVCDHFLTPFHSNRCTVRIALPYDPRLLIIDAAMRGDKSPPRSVCGESKWTVLMSRI